MSKPTIQEAAQERQRRALEDYFAAVRRGADATILLPLAEAAGRTSAEAQTDVEAVARVRDLIDAVREIAPARRRLKKAAKRKKKAEAGFEAASAKWLPHIEDATAEEEAARVDLREAEAAARAVLRLHEERPELVPADTLPAAARELVEARHRDEARQAADARRVAAGRQLADARADVDRAKDLVYEAEHEISENSDAILRQRRARLAEAEKRLAAAQEAYRQAEDAARKAECDPDT